METKKLEEILKDKGTYWGPFEIIENHFKPEIIKSLEVQIISLDSFYLVIIFEETRIRVPIGKPALRCIIEANKVFQAKKRQKPHTVSSAGKFPPGR